MSETNSENNTDIVVTLSIPQVPFLESVPSVPSVPRFTLSSNPTPIELLYDRVLKLENCELQFNELPFMIDGCKCYYIFSVIKPSGHSYSEEFQRKYTYIHIGIRIVNVFWSECCEEEVLLDVKSIRLVDGIEKFKKVIDKFNSKRNGYKIISNDDSVELMDIKEYDNSILTSEVFGIELDKCYICFEKCLFNEKLHCGHNVHLKCAYELYNHTKKNFYKCGICRVTTKRIIINDLCEDE